MRAGGSVADGVEDGVEEDAALAQWVLGGLRLSSWLCTSLWLAPPSGVEGGLWLWWWWC